MESWTNVGTLSGFGHTLSCFKAACGITVYVANVPGPLVHGYFSLATEAHDDDGLPHTLEHLVFLGSDKYPWKGLLDKLANRCFAQGTNAWTDTDHTCYTLSTAGSEGFLQLLPIYLDHILFATCSETGFVTEVHHVTGDGQDAGVVYSEMQARENGQDDTMSRALFRALYPGHCGYKSETGGMMLNLRTSCTHQKVQQYHRDFYRPENLCVLVVGQVDASDVLASLAPVLQAVAAKPNTTPFVRPWQAPVPPLPESVELSVQFPSDDDTTGELKMAWRGPLWTEHYLCQALEVLLDYLTTTAVAPLQAALVQCEEAMCNDVYSSIVENSELALIVTCANVAVESLETIADEVRDVLAGVAAGAQFDHDQLLSILGQRRRALVEKAESNPDELFSSVCITHFLYGKSDKDLADKLSALSHLDALAAEPAEFWQELVRRWLLDSPSVTILGHPDVLLAKELSAQEAARISQQRTALGPDGLAACQKQLDEAIAANSIEPSQEAILAVPIPAAERIPLHSLSSWTTPAPDATPASQSFPAELRDALAALPVFVHADEFASAFVTISVAVPVPSDPKLRLHLELLNDLFWECPVRTVDGETIDYEDVVAGLTEDVVSYSAHLGIAGEQFRPGSLSELEIASVIVPAEAYACGVQWLGDVFFRSQFDAERISMSYQRIQGDVAESERDGVTVARALMKNALYSEKGLSTIYACNIHRQHRFLSQLETQLESNPDSIIEALQTLVKSFASPSLSIHLAGPLSSIDDLVTPLKTFIPLPESAATPLAPYQVPSTASMWTLSPARSVLLPLASVESTYLMQVVPCAAARPAHPDHAALLVLIEYLTACEGPMWREIRGQGLSYNYFIRMNSDEGTLYFGLFQSAQPAAAYNMARTIVEAYASGAQAFTASAIEAAVAAVIFEHIEQERSLREAATAAFENALLGSAAVPLRVIIPRVQQVRADMLVAALHTHLLPLFSVAASMTAVCCSPNKASELIQTFQELGRPVLQPQTLDDAIAL